MPAIVYVDEQQSECDNFILKAILSECFSEDEIVSILPKQSIEETIDEICALNCELLITDYRLKDHNSNVSFLGHELVASMKELFLDFPCFVATSHASEAIDEELDAELLFSKHEFMINDDDEEDEEGEGVDAENHHVPFFKRVRRKLDVHRQKLKGKDERFQELAKESTQRELSAEEMQELIDLDDYLEKIHGSDSAHEKHIKEEAIKPFNDLIASAEKLIQQVETELASVSNEKEGDA